MSATVNGTEMDEARYNGWRNTDYADEIDYGFRRPEIKKCLELTGKVAEEIIGGYLEVDMTKIKPVHGAEEPGESNRPRRTREDRNRGR